ncbi:ethylene-responsive transcription factor CRF5-like [Capsicum galapagoense]
MAFNEEHGEKEVFRNRSEVIAMEKLTDQIGGSSSILPRPGVVHFSDSDPMKLTTDEEGKAKPPKERKRNFKLPQEKVKKYKGVRQKKQGKWVADVRVVGTKDRIRIGTFSTVEEATLAYDKTVNEMKGAYAVTNILKPPPRYPSPTEIIYMNPPSSSIYNARI